MTTAHRTHPQHRRLALLGAGLVLTVGLAACGSKATTGSTSPSPSSSPSTSQSIAPSTSPAPAAAATVDVVPDPSTIGAFSPPSITIMAGQTVQWVFKDANPHTVTADDGSFTSDHTGLANGQTFTHTFTTAGTYTYHCFIHPQMHGTVIVQ
jgi:plastocyanin